MLVSIVNTNGFINNTRNRETCFEAGLTVSDFSLSYQIDRLVSVNPTSNPTFEFLIDHALIMTDIKPVGQQASISN